MKGRGQDMAILGVGKSDGRDQTFRNQKLPPERRGPWRMRSTYPPVPSTSTRFVSITASDDNHSLYLEDEGTNIWRYELRMQMFRRIWDAPRFSYSPRMIFEHRGHLLFVSDHEGDFAQIYNLDLQDSSLKRLYPSSHDQYSPRAGGEGRYTFRTNSDGNFTAGELRGKRYAAISPTNGVVYDFTLDFGTPVLLYSNDRLPTSLVRMNHGTPMPLLPLTFDVRQPPAIPIRNADGMTNLLYLPSASPRGWLIWLHGGPHEQVSPRFNLYFDFLAKKTLPFMRLTTPALPASAIPMS